MGTFFDKKLIFISKKEVGWEGEMEAIETMMAQLTRRRTFLRGRQNGLSPTTRIPSEVLIGIFQMACQPVDAVTPLFIGSICRLWRDTAWSTPLLWNTIFLHISGRRHSVRVQLLGDWLSRARLAPLTIEPNSLRRTSTNSLLVPFKQLCGSL